MPPDFADVEYWNARFQTETEPFEWLKNPDELLPHIRASLELVAEEDRNILHIGPGSSALSLRLRDLVSDPWRVHNVDYSPYAIEMGKQLEQKVFSDITQGTMHWTCSDLLDPKGISKLTHDDVFDPKYSLIVDKSAADALSCGPDISLCPRMFRTASLKSVLGNGDGKTRSEVHKVHPMILLMLHLAVMAAQGARWLCLSYSNERFSAMLNHSETESELEELTPSRYWIVENIKSISAQIDGDDCDEYNTAVHRPRVMYWLYTLKRTQEQLALLST